MSSIWLTAEIPWAGIPPPGETRHETDPPSNSGSVIGFGAMATLIAVTVVCLRLNVRLLSSRGLKLDDWFILMSTMLLVCFFVICVRLTAYGVGTHIWEVLLDNYSPGILQLIFLAQIIGASTISFNKLSVLSLYISITPNKKFRAAVYFLMVIVVAFTLTYVLTLTLDCQPVQSQWDLRTPGHCKESTPTTSPIFILSLINIFVDVAVVILPIPVIVPLRIPSSDKISCLLLFAAGGGLVLIAAVGRTIELMPLLKAEPGQNFIDITWLVVPELNWAVAEGSVGIVAASLPSIRPIFKRMSSADASGGSGGETSHHDDNDSVVALESVSGGSGTGSKTDEQPRQSPRGYAEGIVLRCGHGRDEEEGLCPCQRTQGGSGCVSNGSGDVVCGGPHSDESCAPGQRSRGNAEPCRRVEVSVANFAVAP